MDESSITRKEFYRPAEVEQMFGIKVKTLANMRWLRKGPAYTRFGNKILYSAVEIEQYLKARQVDPKN